MGKRHVLWIVLALILIALFNTFFFMLGGTDHPASVWISYAFIHFAYGMMVATPFLTRKSKSAAIFGFALATISAVFFFVEFLVALIFILIAPESHTAALLIQLTIIAIYGISLVSHLIANERTADAEEKRAVEIAYVKTASIKLKGMLDRVEDPEAAKKVEKVYDTVYSSPTKSDPSLEQQENFILQSIGQLEMAVIAGNAEHISSLADSLLISVNERNNQLQVINSQ